LKKLKKLNEEGLTGPVGSFDAGDTGIAYKTAASVPGMGTIQYPTRDSEGSGDTPNPQRKKKKKNKKKKISEMKYLKIMEEYISGGIAKGKSLEDIAKHHNIEMPILIAQLAKGEKVESEHTSDIRVAKEISMDHLWEDPKYYDKLDKIEASNENIVEVPIEEDFGSGMEGFETKLSRSEIDTWNEQKEWKSLSVSLAKISWNAELEVRKFGIEGIVLTVDKIYLLGDVDSGEETNEWELVITSDQIEIETEKNDRLIPLYPSNIDVDFNNSSEMKNWKVKVTFGIYA